MINMFLINVYIVARNVGIVMWNMFVNGKQTIGLSKTWSNMGAVYLLTL